MPIKNRKTNKPNDPVPTSGDESSQPGDEIPPAIPVDDQAEVHEAEREHWMAWFSQSAQEARQLKKERDRAIKDYWTAMNAVASLTERHGHTQDRLAALIESVTSYSYPETFCLTIEDLRAALAAAKDEK